MKTLMYLFASFALVAVACNNESGDGEELLNSIKPVLSAGETGETGEADKEIIAFFEKYLPESNDSRPTPEFDFGTESNETVCLMINSVDKFKAVAPPSAKLPSIDFEKYTLVIGQHLMGDPGYRIKKQGMNAESNPMTLTLLYDQLEGGTPAIMTTFYFWGMYPKLPQKPVKINIVRT